ncbi:YrrS family protein [Brochothrix campestris]|uniref:YrrS family protein n=1 Tax=Brochothrix campestris TaxID=2757 RepID=UPI0038D16525
MSEQKRYRGQGKRQRTQPKQPMETSTTTAGNSRLTKSQRRKKTNLILNIMIGVLLVLIATTLYFVILTTGNNEPLDGVKVAKNEVSSEQVKQRSDDDASSSTKKKQTTQLTKKITKGESNSTIKETWTADWQPIGTKQTGQHVNSYESTTVDWSEKLAAVAAALEQPVNVLEIWYVENGSAAGSDSIATVSLKSGGAPAYRAYLSWVDQKGWQVDKIEVLTVNDKKE